MITARISCLGPDAADIEIEGEVVKARRTGANWRFGPQRAARWHVSSNCITLFGPGGFSARIADPLEQAAGASAGSDIIEAPMPGLLARLLVAPGDRVVTGQKLAVLEAMKMEHVLSAPRDAVVAEVLVGAGNQIEAHAPLIRFERDAG